MSYNHLVFYMHFYYCYFCCTVNCIAFYVFLLFLCIQKCNRPYAKIINNNKNLPYFFPLLFYVVGWQCCCCTHIFIIREIKKPLCVCVCLYSHMNIYLHLIFYRYICNLMQLCTLLLFGIALYAFFFIFLLLYYMGLSSKTFIVFYICYYCYYCC